MQPSVGCEISQVLSSPDFFFLYHLEYQVKTNFGSQNFHHQESLLFPISYNLNEFIYLTLQGRWCVGGEGWENNIYYLPSQTLYMPISYFHSHGNPMR